jgi:hypothetical protein
VSRVERVDPINIKIKIIIIIVLKLNLEDQPGAKPRYGLRGLTLVDSGQHNNKRSYYHSFKIQLGSRSGQDPGRGSRGSSQVYPKVIYR